MSLNRFFISDTASDDPPKIGDFWQKSRFFGKISRTLTATWMCGHLCGRRVASNQFQTVFFSMLRVANTTGTVTGHRVQCE